jgi:hypothetical protein
MSKETLTSEKNIELHHESVEEIMGTPPASMLRVGSGILLLVIVGLFAGSHFITYPDIEKASAVLQGNFPLSIQTSPETGKISQIFHISNDLVETGDTLFCVENNFGQIFAVLAESSGIVELNPLSTVLNFVQKNDTIAVIWEKETASVACIIQLSPEQGKNVKEGNKIRLHIDKYPSEQYGTVDTYIVSVSHFNSGKDNQVIAVLSGKIITSNHQEIIVKGKNYASEEIKTGKKTLFNRLINPFRSLIKNN